MSVKQRTKIERRALLHISKAANMPELPVKGMPVWNRDLTQVGEMTGGSRLCKLEGCTGRAIGVRWPDRKITFPCTKGLEVYKHGVKIG